MAKAKKLPSGSWNVQVYSHSEFQYDDSGNMILDKTGKPVVKKIYESFTDDDKATVELMAAEFKVNKRYIKNHPEKMTLNESITKYINSKDALLSPKTIEEYRKIQKNGFSELMEIKLVDLTTEMLQEAVNREAKRPNKKCTKNPKPISSKTVRTEYGLISTVIAKYNPRLDTRVSLPAKVRKIKNLPSPDAVYQLVKDTEIELPCLIAMWLSFSMSEIRGLKKSSIQGDYITINSVIVDVENKPVEKEVAKVDTRIRKHRIPPYIKQLIDQLPAEQEYLVTLSGSAISKRFAKMITKSELPYITFHNLRHINASVMALLRVPDNYAMERGGWKSDRVMKETYTHTFSEPREHFDDLIDAYFESKMQD